MLSKQTQQWLFAAITFFVSVQAIGECIPAPPKIEDLGYEKCTTTWTPKSCDTLGTWQSPNLFYEAQCENRGCSVRGSASARYCSGIPCCSTSNTANTLICQSQRDCACIPGYKKFNGSCQPAICGGVYVLGETWYDGNPGGKRIFHTCLADGTWTSDIVCEGAAYVLWDGRCVRPGIPPP